MNLKRFWLVLTIAVATLLFGYLILVPIAEWMAPGDPPNPQAIDSTRGRLIQYLALGTIGVGLLNWRLAVKRRTTDR